MTHHDGEDIVPDPVVQKRVIAGRIYQVHRTMPVAEEGDTFDINGSTFEITDVTERTLGDLNQADIRQEDANSWDEYQARLQAQNPEFEWSTDSTLYRYQFSRRPSMDPE
jgi:hypothetical protein